MKKLISIILAFIMLFAMAACGKQAEPEIREWTRQGTYEDENGNHLIVNLSDTPGYEGWAVSFMHDGEASGWIIQQEGNALHGDLNAWDEANEPYIVTISEESESGLRLEVEGGDTYHFTLMDLPKATIIVTVNIDGWGQIAYAEGEEAPEFDPDFPSQSAYIGIAEPAVHTFAAQPEPGNLFVKWTKNGEDLSTEPQITVLLDESADYIAVFEEDPGWQSPVMGVAGQYQCGELQASVESFGFDEAFIKIEKSTGENEVTRWIIVGKLDEDTQTISYDSSSKADLVLDEDGFAESEDRIYDDGTGTIVFNADKSFTWHDDMSESGEDLVFEWIEVPFAYEHDPRENPEAMADIIEDPDAVYGFSPDPESARLGTFAEYNWSDPDFVAQAKSERIAYHESMDSMTDILYSMRDDGATTEEMARAVSAERNRLRLAVYEDDPEGFAAVKESNLKAYGHEEGPTADELFDKYGSWTTVLQKAFSPNMGMDACCGLYDDYYWLYIELGYMQ